jgi:ABC-type dipeptide/oligopeptide/nickel transport system permease subunit
MSTLIVHSYWNQYCKQFIKDRIGRTALILLIILVVSILAGSLIVPWSPLESNYLNRNQGISAAHWFGTDSLGRDNLSRVLYGGRVSLMVGLFGMLGALFIGGGGGLLAASLGGVVDFLYFGLVDLVRSMPGPLLAMILVISLGQGLVPVIIALGFIFAPLFARLARALYQREMSMDYIIYSKTNKASIFFILGRHILPNILGAFFTQAFIILPRAIVTESVLSFLGMGVSPDNPTWGKIISNESQYLEENAISVLVPVIALSLFTAILTVIGNRIRRFADLS